MKKCDVNQQGKTKVDIKEREGGERKTAKRELKKRHGGRGEGNHLIGGVAGNGRFISVSSNHRNLFS